MLTVPSQPKTKKTPDTQYREILQLIMDHGTRVMAQAGGEKKSDTDTISYIAPPPMRFDLENGFPLLTERNLAPDFKKVPTVWKQAIGEIIGFINGARTQSELEKYGCHWWKYWVTAEKCQKRGLEPGDLGPGSYGAAFHDFPTAEGDSYNQVKNIVEQIIELPHLKTHFISPWIPQYTIRGTGKKQQVVVCPCHGWMHFFVRDGKLSLHMFQRSGDVPIGIPQNMAQYAALVMMVAQATGNKPGELIHTISDAHIYVNQLPAVEEILKREPRPFPTMKLNTDNTDIFKFRVEDFELSDYHPHPGIKGIPAAI